MNKTVAINALFSELNEIETALEKANIASKYLYNNYFGCYSEKNPNVIKKFDEASCLHGMVADYIQQSCKLLNDLLY